MLRSIYPALPALVITVSSHAQSLEWATAVGGAGQEIGYAVCSDSEGSVITVGTFVQTVDLDPGPGVFNVSTPNSSDVFIQKLDGDGNFVWGGAFGNTGADLGLGVTPDAINHVIAPGKVSPVTAPALFETEERPDAGLRNAEIRAELYLGNPKNMGNQLKYADKRNSPCVIIQGSDEKANGKVQIKDLILGAGLTEIKDREEYLKKQAEAQYEVDESRLVEAVREVLARHDVTWG